MSIFPPLEFNVVLAAMLTPPTVPVLRFAELSVIFSAPPVDVMELLTMMFRSACNINVGVDVGVPVIVMALETVMSPDPELEPALP